MVNNSTFKKWTLGTVQENCPFLHTILFKVTPTFGEMWSVVECRNWKESLLGMIAMSSCIGFMALLVKASKSYCNTVIVWIAISTRLCIAIHIFPYTKKHSFKNMFDATTRLQGSYAQIQRMALQPETAIKLYQKYFIVSVKKTPFCLILSITKHFIFQFN